LFLVSAEGLAALVLVFGRDDDWRSTIRLPRVQAAAHADETMLAAAAGVPCIGGARGCPGKLEKRKAHRLHREGKPTH